MSRMVCLAAAWTLALSSSMVCSRAFGQIPSSPTSTQTTAQSQAGDSGSASVGTSDNSEDSGEHTDTSISPGNLAPQTALSADQIINTLQQSPDLVVELKSELVDRLEQQGVQIDPNGMPRMALTSEGADGVSAIPIVIYDRAA